MGSQDIVPDSARDVSLSDYVLLFNSRLKLIAGKLHSRWDSPFVITNIFHYGVVELRDETSNKIFQVNGHQLKHFHEGPTQLQGEVESKLRSRWDGPFVITNVFPYGVVELKDENTKNTFQ
ncbi:hypothetical protein CR513_13239, partial [Mucuna pruriens]